MWRDARLIRTSGHPQKNLRRHPHCGFPQLIASDCLSVVRKDVEFDAEYVKVAASTRWATFLLSNQQR